MGQMVVTMQETFAGIRVVKSFAREKHQENLFRRSNRLQFQNMMRIIRAMEAIGPLVEIIAAFGIGLALLYIYFANLSAARFIALNLGIVLLYEPIKTLSKMHVIMQQSIQATTEVFAIMDLAPTVQDAPNAKELRHCDGLIEFDRRNVPLRQRCHRCRDRLESAHRARQNLRARRRERRGQEHDSVPHPAAL